MKLRASRRPTPWLWTPKPLPRRNAFLRFRNVFTVKAGISTTLRISADSRYWLWLNGEYLGSGPVRSWPGHWKFDEYNISLSRGQNILAVLVNHWGTGNFQYLSSDAGLWVELDVSIPNIRGGWKCSESRAMVSKAPRISAPLGFEEQFDARISEPWQSPAFDAQDWPAAVTIAPPHPSVGPSGIPHMTSEEVWPQRIVKAEQISAPVQTWTLDVRRLLLPEDTSSQKLIVRGFLYTQIWSSKARDIELLRPHHHGSEIKLNGATLPALKGGFAQKLEPQKARLKSGWNQLVIPYPDADSQKCGYLHLAQFVLTIRSSLPLVWSASQKKCGTAWLFVGPFQLTDAQRSAIRANVDYPRLSIAEAAHVDATPDAFDKLYRDAGRTIEFSKLPYAIPFNEECVIPNDAFALACGDKVRRAHSIEKAESLLSGNAEWAEIPKPLQGNDVRMLLDFGSEVVGSHRFEIDAAEGTIVDFFNFEFIQPDGRENYAEGMNNSLRYICRDGRQAFRSLQRRGFQYSYLILRNMRAPVRVRSVSVDFTTYPQARRGRFESSDALLNKIWEVGAHTLRCCAEDTYTDCPTYEQTHWVGDARNEALVDWVINGDLRLWFRCLEQTGQSLELDCNPVTASQVPSSWPNLLPSWSFLWMRSCSEYLLWTGDYQGATILLEWVVRNVDGMERHINSQNLFELQAWNMFDWAEMDTPAQGIVTHVNCFAVQALRDCAEMARWLKQRRVAKRFENLADKLAAAINAHLWDARMGAYTDCIRADGKKSPVFSQQTATAALISGVARGERAKCCRRIVHAPPKDFVKAGSPFFEFFLLEVLKAENREAAFLDVIRRDWGFMIEQGATAFWEMWSLRDGRLTRSHCHGWSAAPTFFLSSTVLGVEPAKPGFAEVRIVPKLGDLRFARGVMPTPYGPIEISANRVGKRVEFTCKLPKGVRLEQERRGFANLS